MEKINTPLQILIEELDSKIGTRKYVSELVSIRKRAVELQQTEREVIEKAFTQGATEMDHLHNDREESFSHAQDYFTQTFKSYEEA